MTTQFHARQLAYPMLAVLAAACFGQYDPFANQITTSKPVDADVAGAYLLESQTLTRDRKLDFLHGQPATIELLPNGTYTATNFPVWRQAGTGHYVFDKLLTVSGRWQTGSVGSVDSHRAWGVLLYPALDTESLSPNLRNDKAPYGLIFTYGDPDSGYILIYDKSK